MADLMGGFGVNADIPLRAGQGAAAPVNPLETIGKFVGIQNQINHSELQRQAITSGKATVAQHLQQVGNNAMLPFLAIENPTMKDLTGAAAYAEGIAGGTTQHIMQIAQNNPFPPDTPQWGMYMKRSIAGLAQTDPGAAVGQIAGAPADVAAGGTIFSGVRAPVTAGGGFTPSTSTDVSMTPGDAGQQVQWTGTDGATHFGTKVQYNEALGNGQVNRQAAVRPYSSAPPATVPQFGAPNGRYPANPALRNSTTSPTSAPVETPPAPGARKAPDGKWYVSDPARPGKYLEVR